MLWHILDLCISVAVLGYVAREIAFPLLQNKPMFPLTRKTIKGE